jgi:ribosome-binding protein aMBF1 (putative translation factor)
MSIRTITRNGRRFVEMPLEEYKHWKSTLLPPIPPVDSDGTTNAIDFARASIARRLMTERHKAGLSQQQLSRLARVRQETISRIESGKQTATVRIIDKLDKAIQAAQRRMRKSKAG